MHVARRAGGRAAQLCPTLTLRSSGPAEHGAARAQRGALEDALRQLYLLDALDDDGRVTGLGRAMSALPLEPSLARSLLAAAELGCLPDALTVAAMLSAESVFVGNRRAPHAARCRAAEGRAHAGAVTPLL